MSKKRDEGGDPHFKGAAPEALARALLRPISRPSAGQGQTDGGDEVVFLRRKRGRSGKEAESDDSKQVVVVIDVVRH